MWRVLGGMLRAAALRVLGGMLRAAALRGRVKMHKSASSSDEVVLFAS
jgi:hypothetical protein